MLFSTVDLRTTCINMKKQHKNITFDTCTYAFHYITIRWNITSSIAFHKTSNQDKMFNKTNVSVFNSHTMGITCNTFRYSD